MRGTNKKGHRQRRRQRQEHTHSHTSQNIFPLSEDSFRVRVTLLRFCFKTRRVLYICKICNKIDSNIGAVNHQNIVKGTPHTHVFQIVLYKQANVTTSVLRLYINGNTFTLIFDC